MKKATAISHLELRVEKIPESDLLRVVEKATGKLLREESRYYLTGVPVNCGDVIEVWDDDLGNWKTGRFEWSGKIDESPVVLFSENHGKSIDKSMHVRWIVR